MLMFLLQGDSSWGEEENQADRSRAGGISSEREGAAQLKTLEKSS